MQTPRRSRKPRSKAMLGPPRRSKQNGAGTLYEQHAQIAISAFGDAAKDRTITRRHLLRHQTKPSSKITPFRKGGPIADRGYHRACNDRPNTRNGHQPPTVLVGAGQGFDLICYSFDALIEIFPVVNELSNDPDHTRR